MFVKSLFGITGPFYSPDDNINVNLDEGEKSELEILNDDDKGEEDPDKKDDEGDDKGDEEDPDKKGDEDLDEDEEDPDKKKDDEDEEDEEEATARISYSSLKAKHPELFKGEQGKQLKAIIFREQAFSEKFPTVEAADAAIADQIRFNDLRDLVLSGNAEELLSNIREVSADSLDTFAESFLPSLLKLNEDLYTKTTDPIIKNVIHGVFKEAKRTNNKNLENAAILFNRLLFESDSPSPGRFKQPVKDEKLEKDKEEFFTGKRNELLRVVSGDCERKLINAIEDGLDPTKVLEKKPKLRKRIVDAIITEIRSKLGSDEAHMRNINSLWERERRLGYSGQLKGSIVSAYLSRAKAILPKIRREVRADFLGTVKESDSRRRETGEERIQPGNSNNNRGRGPITVKDAKDKKMSEKDVLFGGRA